MLMNKKKQLKEKQKKYDALKEHIIPTDWLILNLFLFYSKCNTNLHLIYCKKLSIPTSFKFYYAVLLPQKSTDYY